MKKERATKSSSKASRRVSHLCHELKAQLDDLDKPVPKKNEPSPSQKIKKLFEELKEKLNTVS